MNSTLRNILIAALVLLAALLLWRNCNNPGPTTDHGPTADTGATAPPTTPEPLEEDTSTAGAPYPMPPEAGEKTDVNWGGAGVSIYDRPTMYVSRDVAAGKFKRIIIAIPHGTAHTWKFNTVTTGSTITFNFSEDTYTGTSPGVFVYIDESAGTRNLSGVTSVRAVAALAGGGSDDDIVTVSGTDDEGSITTWTQGMPFFWHKQSGSNVIVGGFLYGLNNTAGANQTPSAFSGPTPNPGAPGIILASTVTGTAKMYQAIPQLTFSNPTGVNSYKAELNLSPTTPDRCFYFQD
jgi:hypothetical protein